MLVKEKKALNDILGRINKAIEFLEEDKIVICVNNNNQYSDSYVRKDGKVLNEIKKFVGSDLNQLKNAKHELINLIEQDNNQ